MLRLLFKFHSEWMAIAMAMTNTKQDAEDLVHDMYIRVHEKVESVDKITYGDDDINRYFIYLTIRNLARDNLRRRKPDINYIDYIEELDREDEPQMPEVINEINQEINSWEWYDKTLFRLYMETDMSMRDIATGSNISLGNIFGTIRDCKNKLKDKFGKNGKKSK